MSIEVCEKQQALSVLKERLIEIELEQKNGAKYYTLEQLEEVLHKLFKSK